MSRAELQEKIQQLLDSVPDSVLAELLEYLKGLNSNSANDVSMAMDLRKILEEDKELLKRLAS